MVCARASAAAPRGRAHRGHGGCVGGPALARAGASTPRGQIGRRAICGGASSRARPAPAAAHDRRQEPRGRPSGAGAQSRRDRHHRPAWASRIARGEGSVEGKAWLDFSLDRDAFQRIAWRNVSAALESEPARFRDALVLVGGEFAASGDEAHLIPDGVTSPALVSGLLLQALAVNTILDGLPIRQAPVWPWVLASATAAAMGAFALLVRPAWRGTLAA